PAREIDQWQRHGERNQCSPGDRHQSVVAAGVRDDAKNFTRGFLLGRADGLGNARFVDVRDHDVTSSPRRRRHIIEAIRMTEEKTAPATGPAEGTAATGEAAAPGEAAGPGRARRSPRPRDRNEDRSARASSRSCAGLRVSAASAGDTADNHEENEQKEQKRENIEEARLVVRPLFGARFPFLGIDRHRLDDVIDPTTDATGEIVGPKTRNDGVLYDELRYRVGERTFEAVTDLDAHLAFVRRHDQQRAGILLFLSDLPVTPELVAVVLNRGSLKRLQRNHNELAGGLGLELGELALEPGLGRRVQNSGIVDDTAGELRKGEGIGRKRN